MTALPRIALFTDRRDGHARALLAAFARAGAPAAAVALRDCGFAPDGTLAIPGFAQAPPAAALVRVIEAGSFEEVTLRLGVLHALRACGCLVINDAGAIERAVDKAMTSFLLARAGLPTPETWVTPSASRARAILAAEAAPGRPLVLKPLFGSQGRGQALLDSPAALPAAETLGGVFYLQRYVAPGAEGFRDWRVFVIGGRAVAAMLRRHSDWRTNAAQGARCEAAVAAGPLAELAVAAAAAVGADFAGVDLIRDGQGRLAVLEVNSNPAWSALRRATGIAIAPLLVRHLLDRLGRPLAQAG